MARIISITDMNDPALDAYVRLTGAQLRSRLEPERAIFIAESPSVIAVALEAGYEPLSLLTERRLINGAVGGIIASLPEDMPVYVAERDELRTLTGYELTRGALCAMRRPDPRTLEEVCRGARRIAVLEEIADSTNVGALFRSAAALGIDAILITPTCCDPLCRRAIRVSMGTVFQIPWARIGEPEDRSLRVDLLHDLGFRCCAMALRHDTLELGDERLRAEERLAIVLGTEGTGLRAETIDACDHTVKIPMHHGVDSLNVAAAGAIAFWELTKR